MNFADVTSTISGKYQDKIDTKKQDFYSGFIAFLDSQKEAGDITETHYQEVLNSLNNTNVEKTLIAWIASELANVPIITPLEVGLVSYLATLDIDMSSKGIIFVLSDRVLKIILAYPIAKVVWVTHAKTFAALKVVPSAGILPVLGTLWVSDSEFTKQYIHYQVQRIQKILMSPALQSALRVMV